TRTACGGQASTVSSDSAGFLRVALLLWRRRIHSMDTSSSTDASNARLEVESRCMAPMMTNQDSARVRSRACEGQRNSARNGQAVSNRSQACDAHGFEVQPG